MFKERSPAALLGLSLALIFVGGFGAHRIQTDGGRVQVLGLRLPTEDGQWVAADLFRPKGATEKNPAPLVVVCPGFERSKETMAAYSIELARRGMVVITIDPYSQGASSSSRQRQSATLEGYGVVPVVEYAYGTPNLNYIDKAKIGAVGYSAGGNGVLQSVSRFGAAQARALKQAKAPDSEGGETVTDGERAAARRENKIAAAFIGGYVLTLTDKVLSTVKANLGIDYASHDEGAYRNELGHARLEAAPEALRLVNSGQPDATVSAVDIGRMYGDPAKGTLRVVHNTRMLHPLMPYDPRHIENTVAFFETAFGWKSPVPPSDQVWPMREMFTLMALVGGLMFLVPFAALLLRLPFFATLAQPPPPALPVPDRTGRIVFWSLFVAGALVACFLFIPMARATQGLFPDASNRTLTWFFPQRINNAILLWAVANGLFGFAVFFLGYALHGRKRGVTTSMWGAAISMRDLAKTFVLAATVVAGFYALLFVSYGAFHTDFRFTFVSAAASFSPKMLLVALEYIPLFFIFYLANALRVNAGARFEGQSERVSLMINAAANSVGLILLLVIQYASLALTGMVYWTEEWLYINLLLGVIPMMILLPLFNRWFFRLTGRIYLGPMITCPVFVLMMLTSNVCYIPL